ncbi:MAG: hypothetical protein HDR04_07650 [Lachnospiraceae bacterium]|nr:hypothetical protein [Lachnospiraceae bacterium]
MKRWLEKDPTTANDDITWSISKTSAATISNDGFVTVKKYDSKKPANNTFTVTAVSELGKTATATLTVGEGKPANEVKIYEDKAEPEEDVLLKGTVKVDAGGDEPWTGMDVYAKMIAKDGTDYGITDDITWSIGKTKTEIIRLTNVAGTEATLEPVNVGTAKITATATSGKKASFSVKVSAALNGLIVDVDTAPTDAFTGQSFTLGVERDPEMNNDALTWSVWADEACTQKSKDVTINAKGVLKVKNTLQADAVYVKVQSKKDKKIANTDGIDKNTLGPQTVRIGLNQSSINGIAVTNITNAKDPKPVTKVWLEGTKQKKEDINKAKTDIRIPVNGVYQAEVIEAVEGWDNGTVESFSWTNSNSKVAEMVPDEKAGTVIIKPLAKGTTKITVSGIKVTKWNDDAKTSAKTAKVIKAQFTVNVIQPTTSLKLNKTDIVLYPKANKQGVMQKQSVSLKATMNPKGAADLVNWTVLDKNGKTVAEGVLTNKTKASGKNNVNYKVEFAAPALGDVYTV